MSKENKIKIRDKANYLHNLNSDYYFELARSYNRFYEELKHQNIPKDARIEIIKGFDPFK